MIELLVGTISLIAGLAIYLWAMQLVWITIYPPPIEKRILDILPYIIWAGGIVLIIDSIRRILLQR